jgi:metallo-beta-lactamase family protein
VITLTFLGAARTVTGSKYLVDTGQSRVLVDCGLFQGLKELRARTWDGLPVEARALDAVVLTHAHLDHVGYLPRLAAQGFRGRIVCTAGTADLCRIVLPDAGRIQEEDARQANKHGYSKHAPALPLFTEDDAFQALSLLAPVGYGKRVGLAPGIDVEFAPTGHLLGSASILMSFGTAAAPRILFGGDLGRYARPVLPDPAPAPAADVLLVESTYGDREHEADAGAARLAEIVIATSDRGGKIVIPAFAIGRVEELLYWIKQLEEDKRIPVLPVYLDSPMALDALKFYSARYRELDPDIRPAGRDVSAFATRRFEEVHTPQQSKQVTASRRPAIVISSSGMATGGRVLHHLKAALPDPRHTVLFTGYQAQGTRGRDLVDGAQRVKIHGEMVEVRARVEKIDSMSAHAGQGEILRWLATSPQPPATTVLVHGEAGPMEALQAAVTAQLGWKDVRMPEHQETVEL